MFELRPDQIEDLAALIRNPRHGLWSEPGTGKTPVACLYTWWNWSDRQKKTIWVQPLAIIKKNRDELLRFTKFRPEDVEIFKGPPPHARLLKLLSTVKGGSVYMTKGKIFHDLDAINPSTPMSPKRIEEAFQNGYLNLELLPTVKFIKAKKKKDPKIQLDFQVSLSEAGEKKLKQIRIPISAKVLLMGADAWGSNWSWILSENPDFDVLIGDEWHKMYSTNDSQRTQELYWSARKISRIVPMTGTLVRGRLDSSYSAIHLIEPRYYANYQSFLNRHAVKDEWGSIKNWVGAETIREILLRHGQLRYFKDIYGDVPAVFQTHYVEMSGPQKEAYKEFAEKAILELENMFLDGTMPGVNLIRAREILSCPEKFNIGVGVMTARDALLDVQISDHLQSGAPWLIGSACVPEQERVLAQLLQAGIKADLMNGSCSQRKRGEQDLDFREGRLQALIVNPEVGSIGFNWGHCDHVTFLHLSYFHDDFEQFWKRTTRGVRTRPVLIDTLVYDESVEGAVLGILIKKMVLANEVDPNKQVINLHSKETELT